MSDVPPTNNGWSLWAPLATGGLIAVNEFVFRYFSPCRPFTKEYQRDMIYVYQFPRTPFIPSLSSNCLALETWLRFANIKYENIVGPAWYRSKEKILPFIEINGSEHSGTNDIILHLSESRQRLDLEGSSESGSVKKIENVIEDLMWCYFYFRYVKNKKVLLSKKFIGNNPVKLPVMPWCSPVFIRLMLNNSDIYRYGDEEKLADLISKSVSEKMQERGFARLIETEITDRARDHFKLITDNMGNNQYLFGNRVSSTDCILFGVLAQIVYVPYKSPLKNIMKKEYKVLIEHCERMKRAFWPDWEKILKTGKMNNTFQDDDSGS